MNRRDVLFPWPFPYMTLWNSDNRALFMWQENQNTSLLSCSPVHRGWDRCKVAAWGAECFLSDAGLFSAFGQQTALLEDSRVLQLPKKKRGSSGCFIDIMQFEKFVATFWSVYVFSSVLCMAYKVGRSFQSWLLLRKRVYFKSMFEIVVKTYQYLAMLKWEGWMVLWSARQNLIEKLDSIGEKWQGMDKIFS